MIEAMLPKCFPISNFKLITEKFYIVASWELCVRLILVQCSQFTFVCMYVYVCMYVCMYICQTLISITDRTCTWSLHTCECKRRCMNRLWRNLSRLYATALEHKGGSKGCLHHERVGQRKGCVIEWERSDTYRESLGATGKAKRFSQPRAHCSMHRYISQMRSTSRSLCRLQQAITFPSSHFPTSIGLSFSTYWTLAQGKHFCTCVLLVNTYQCQWFCILFNAQFSR